MRSIALHVSGLCTGVPLCPLFCDRRVPVVYQATDEPIFLPHFCAGRVLCPRTITQRSFGVPSPPPKLDGRGGLCASCVPLPQAIEDKSRPKLTSADEATLGLFRWGPCHLRAVGRRRVRRRWVVREAGVGRGGNSQAAGGLGLLLTTRHRAEGPPPPPPALKDCAKFQKISSALLVPLKTQHRRGGGGGVDPQGLVGARFFAGANRRGGDCRNRHRGPAARVPHHRSGG